MILPGLSSKTSFQNVKTSHESKKTIELNEIKNGEADASFTNISITKISSMQRNHAKYGSMSNVNKIPLLGAKVGLSTLIQPSK